MKKLVGVLVALVIVLSGLLVYILLNDNKEETNDNPNGSNDSYHFQDIENMEKADSLEEAFIRIFGEDRLYENNPNFDKEELYFDEKGIFYDANTVYILLKLKPGIDTRMEMIDFLHYLQYSGLTTNETVDKFASNGFANFSISMRVFPPVKPGMNTPKPYEIWLINNDKVEEMNFSDKETMLNEISLYGNFKVVDP